MRLIDKIKYKIPGTGSYYNQKALIWRNRGDSTSLEICDAVRLKYNDRPNIHEISTGERIPAVPKDYVQNLYGGGSYFMAVEGSDDQLVIFKPKFDLEELAEIAKEKVDDSDDKDSEDSSDNDKKIQVPRVGEVSLPEIPLEFDTDLDNDELKKRLEDKNYDAVSFSVLDNRDERFTFLSQEIRTAGEKYGVAHWLKENADILMPVATAIAVFIIMYAIQGDIVPAMQTLSERLANFNSNAQNLMRAMNQTAPPGR